jgi:hypothetical protein
MKVRLEDISYESPNGYILLNRLVFDQAMQVLADSDC